MRLWHWRYYLPDTLMRWLPLVLVLVGCGSASPVAPSVTPAQVSVQAMPAGLDPSYVRAFVSIDASGHPKRWEGGPFHHCAGAGVDAATVERAANRITALSGIPRTEAGPCNVEWAIEHGPPGTNANTTIAGTATGIYTARITFETDPASRLSGTALHEAGHVLGLGHSMRAGDLMNVTYNHSSGEFTADELAVLAWIYRK